MTYYASITCNLAALGMRRAAGLGAEHDRRLEAVGIDDAYLSELLNQVVALWGGGSALGAMHVLPTARYYALHTAEQTSALPSCEIAAQHAVQRQRQADYDARPLRRLIARRLSTRRWRQSLGSFD